MGGAKAWIADRADRPDSRDAHQAPRILVLARARAESPLQLPDLRVEAGNLGEQNLTQFADRLGQARTRICNSRRQPRDMGGTPWGAMTPNSARWPRRALMVCVR